MNNISKIFISILAMLTLLVGCSEGEKQNDNNDNKEVVEQEKEENLEEDVEEEVTISGENNTEIFDGIVVINDEEIQVLKKISDLPIPFKVVGNHAGSSLGNNTMVGNVELEDGNGLKFKVDVFNDTGSSAPVEELKTSGMEFEFKNNKNANQNIIFAKGITKNSSVDDIIAAYGEPDETYGDGPESSYYTMSYTDPSRAYIRITFSKNIMDMYELVNFDG